MVGDVAYLRWQAVSDIDLSHYCIRHSSLSEGAQWSNAIGIVDSVPYDATTITVPALPGTYLIKAIDVGVRASIQAAMVKSPLDVLSGYNVVLDINEYSDGFVGLKENLARIDGALRLDGADEMDDISNIDDIVSIDTGLTGLRAAGSYHFANTHDLGDVYTSRITAQIGVQGLDMSTSVDQWLDVDVNESWDSTVDPASWSAQLQISTTREAPEIESGWSTWSDLLVGDYTARAYKFRLLLTGSGGRITPVMETVHVNIDMPDRYESASNIELSSAGAVVPFANSFRVAPVIQVTAHNLNSGDYYHLSDVDEEGFHLCFFEAGGFGVVRRFDYVAKGYGRALT